MLHVICDRKQVHNKIKKGGNAKTKQNDNRFWCNKIYNIDKKIMREQCRRNDSDNFHCLHHCQHEPEEFYGE